MVYDIEGGVNDSFSTIPQSIYWANVTITTVGYGDVPPITRLGKIIASVIMLPGYAIIAVSTGIVTVEFSKQHKKEGIHNRTCTGCVVEVHDSDAKFCKYGGHLL